MDTIMDTPPAVPAEPQPPVTTQADSCSCVRGTWFRFPAGTFQMGSNDPEAFIDEQPVRTVNVSAFSIDKSEVTNAQYQRVL